MGEQSQLKEAAGLVTILQLAQALGIIGLKEGTGQRSPFRNDAHAGSFSVMRSGFKDHAHAEHKGGLLQFVMLARPCWSKNECAEFVIRAAGMEPECQRPGTIKRIATVKRAALYERKKTAARDLPSLGIPEPGPMALQIRARWNDGQTAIQSQMEKLADGRGWPVSTMRALIGMNKTSLPLLPWADNGDRRGWGWMVEKPVFDSRGNGALVPVGFHSRYKVFQKQADGSTVEEKRWCFVPYLPAEKERLSEFQQFLAEYKTKVPAYPFILGNIDAPRLVIILEGQFDAVSFALAFGWFDKGLPPGVVIMGLRGVQSQAALLAAYGLWLRRHTPFVWIIGDNDKAGRAIDAYRDDGIAADPTFVDRVRAQGCTVHAELIGHSGCKDFNDVWKAAQPPTETMKKWAGLVGAGGFIA